MGDWKEWLFRLAIFIAGGSFGAMIIAIFAGSRRPPSQLRKWCRNCGHLTPGEPKPGEAEPLLPRLSLGAGGGTATFQAWDCHKFSYQMLCRHVFECFQILADEDGVVDMTATAIASWTRVPLSILLPAIEQLSAPAPSSDSPECDGPRIAPLEGRSCGWQIVNFKAYRNLKSVEETS